MAELFVIEDEAMRELIAAVDSVLPTAPTWCLGWSAKEIVAHVTAAARERAELIEEHLAGRPTRATRSWGEREPPFRALPDPDLRRCLVAEAARFERAAAQLPAGDTVEYTGWAMTADLMRRHSHSETSLHRWDLIGDDEVSVRLLSDPALTEHALAAFAALPILLEAQRWVDPPFTSRPLRLRSPDRPDVVIRPGESLSLADPGDDDAAALTMAPWERLLVLWGRCPARLRDPEGNAEAVDDVLKRLVGPQ